MEVLLGFSKTLVGAAGYGEIAQALFRAIDDLYSVDQCVLLSISDDHSRATLISSLGIPDGEPDRFEIDITDDTSALSRVLRDRVAYRVVDARRESQHSEALSVIVGMRSALYVPLVTSAGVIAVAVVGSVEEVRTFRKEHVDLIQKLANDAAVAIDRSRYAQALREVGENELIIASVARAVRESLEPDEVITVAARELGEQTDAERVAVRMLWSEQVDGRECVWTVDGAVVGGYHEDTLEGSAQLAIDDRQTVVGRAGIDALPGTQLSVPLIHRNDLVGVVTINRSHVPFSVSEMKLIELIGVELSAAIEYVRLYQGGRRHLEQQLALSRAAQSLTADLRFDRVIEHLVEEVVKILRTDSAAFYVYDRDEQIVTLAGAVGEEEIRALGEKMGLVGLAGRVISTGVSQYTNNYREDLGERIHPVFETVKRAVAVPVRWQGDLRGVISVATHDTNRMFTAHDVSLLEAFADLASLALHNADAYSAHGRQARIQAGFYRISQVLSASLSRSDTLTSLAQAATEALDGDWAIVVGRPADASESVIEAAFEIPPQFSGDVLAEIGLEGSPAELAHRHNRVITSRDIEGDERVSDSWKQRMADSGIRSLLAVPIQVHGVTSAVVVVCFGHPIKFGDEELVVANNLASAARAALERAGLFDTERHARHLAQVLADVSALLAETLKAQTVLDRIVEQAAVLLDVDACTLAVAENESDDPVLRIDAVAGNDNALIRVLKSADPGNLNDEVGRSKRSVIVEELASETSSQSLDGEQYSSFVGVPLVHPRGYLMGVLSVYSRDHRAWAEAETRALESFAHSAAIAVRNAELYAGVKRERDTIEKLLASIAEGIIATDASGRVTLWNEAAERITGIAKNHAVGRSWRDVLGLDAETRVDDGESIIETHPHGTRMWLSVTSSRLQGESDDGGRILAFRDVSADYALDRLKSDFVATVSYVLRAPLASIYGFAQTLLREDLTFDDDDKRVFMSYIASETERLTEIVDDLLEVTRIDAGSVDVTVTDCNLGEIFENVELLMKEKSNRHTIRASIADAEEVRVKADQGKLEVVLENLINNAIQYSPSGGDVTLTGYRDNGDVHIDVIDSGVGIPHSEQKYLFSKFYVSPHGMEHSGAGLGLYISKGLVQAMGGTISVSSTPGTGSTFTVELPTATGKMG